MQHQGSGLRVYSRSRKLHSPDIGFGAEAHVILQPDLPNCATNRLEKAAGSILTACVKSLRSPDAMAICITYMYTVCPSVKLGFMVLLLL